MTTKKTTKKTAKTKKVAKKKTAKKAAPKPASKPKAKDLSTWVTAIPVLRAAVSGALDLINSPEGKAVAHLFTGDPVADRALADAAGIAKIAGKRHVDADKILEVVSHFITLGLLFV